MTKDLKNNVGNISNITDISLEFQLLQFTIAPRSSLHAINKAENDLK